MQTYNVISMSPFINSFPTCITSDCVNSALKNIVKLYHRFQIEELILADQTNHWKANMNYYKENGRKRVNIGYDVFPHNQIGVIHNGQTVGAIGLTPMKQSVISPYVTPLGTPNSLTESSVVAPFMPSVIYTPNRFSGVNLSGVNLKGV